jgi:hypothetical protein
MTWDALLDSNTYASLAKMATAPSNLPVAFAAAATLLAGVTGYAVYRAIDRAQRERPMTADKLPPSVVSREAVAERRSGAHRAARFAHDHARCEAQARRGQLAPLQELDERALFVVADFLSPREIVALSRASRRFACGRVNVLQHHHIWRKFLGEFHALTRSIRDGRAVDEPDAFREFVLLCTVRLEMPERQVLAEATRFAVQHSLLDSLGALLFNRWTDLVAGLAGRFTGSVVAAQIDNQGAIGPPARAYSVAQAEAAVAEWAAATEGARRVMAEEEAREAAAAVAAEAEEEEEEEEEARREGRPRRRPRRVARAAAAAAAAADDARKAAPPLPPPPAAAARGQAPAHPLALREYERGATTLYSLPGRLRLSRACIGATGPLAFRRTELFDVWYYECRVLVASGSESSLAVGFAPDVNRASELLLWLPNGAVIYDGHVARQPRRTRAFTAVAGSLGVGVLARRDTPAQPVIFLARDGCICEHMRANSQLGARPLCALVALGAQGIAVSLNFGLGPFALRFEDVCSLLAREPDAEE